MTIGVVIPAYQVEAWLDRCLRSVLDQDVTVDEIVVVDDGSTDATADIARRAPGVRLVPQKNAGPSAARNRGLAETTTEWVLFLDSDDVLLPGAIRAYREAILRWPSASVVNPAHELEFPDGRIVRPSPIPPRVYRRRDLATVIRRNPFIGNTLVQRPVAQRFPYDVTLSYAEDLHLYTRVLLAGVEIVRMGEPTMRRLENREGALTRDILRMRRGRRAVFAGLWADRRLSLWERTVTAYQLARVGLGIALAKRRSLGSSMY